MSYEDYEPIVAPIAADFGRKFRRWADTEDIAQELRIWVFRHPEKIAQWERDTEDQAQVDRLLARTLRNEAGRFCQEMKAQAVGYSLQDLAWYSRGELSALLEAMFDREAWLKPPTSEDGGRSVQGDPAVGGNWVATLADLSRAYSQLSETDQTLLASFHKDGMTNVMLAELHGVTPQAMSQKHIKALNRLQKKLGGDRPQDTHDDPCECEPYVGTRRVLSNAAARAVTENQYDED